MSENPIATITRNSVTAIYNYVTRTEENVQEEDEGVQSTSAHAYKIPPIAVVGADGHKRMVEGNLVAEAVLAARSGRPHKSTSSVKAAIQAYEEQLARDLPGEEAPTDDDDGFLERYEEEGQARDPKNDEQNVEAAEDVPQQEYEEYTHQFSAHMKAELRDMPIGHHSASDFSRMVTGALDAPPDVNRRSDKRLSLLGRTTRLESESSVGANDQIVIEEMQSQIDRLSARVDDLETIVRQYDEMTRRMRSEFAAIKKDHAQMKVPLLPTASSAEPATIPDKKKKKESPLSDMSLPEKKVDEPSVVVPDPDRNRAPGVVKKKKGGFFAAPLDEKI